MPTDVNDRIALLDLDGTLADYDASLREEMGKIQAPGEPPYGDRYTEDKEPAYIEARRKMIQRQPRFWIDLRPIHLGKIIVHNLEKIGFELHVLTKGPVTTPTAWTEKVMWCQMHIPQALVTITQEKSLVYGRVLVDDYPPYFTKWLKVRPRGLVVCVAQPWNAGFAEGGSHEHPQVFRFDSAKRRKELSRRLQDAYDRSGRSDP